MSDIALYEKEADQYDTLQDKRPDYVSAIKTFVDVGSRYLAGRKGLVVVDFCCGTGKNSLLLSRVAGPFKKLVLVDINEQFLKIAKQSKINTEEIVLTKSDILKAKLTPECDAVISMFAYHHVPDSEKQAYIKQIRDSLKGDGLLFFGEIYLPDKKITSQYYTRLIEAIPKGDRSDTLDTFLKQTAESSDFEFKVSQDFAHSQLKNNGFTLVESKKIWPAEDMFGEDIGMFFEVWKLN